MSRYDKSKTALWRLHHQSWEERRKHCMPGSMTGLYKVPGTLFSYIRAASEIVVVDDKQVGILTSFDTTVAFLPQNILLQMNETASKLTWFIHDLS